MGKSRKLFAALAVVGIGLVATPAGLGRRCARAAVAAPAPDAPPSAAGKAEARERFDRGLGLFEKGDNAAALAEFKRAYELIPNPIVLYNMGLVYAAMNRPVEASEALDRFLAAAGDKSAPEPRRHARQVRAEQAARVARLNVVTDQPSTVEVDGVEAGRTPMSEPLRLASGAHTVAALAPGYQPSRKEVTLAGQTTETVTLTLVPTETGTAHLTIAVAIPGAEVWINDKLVGTTPLPGNVAVAPGEARVTLRRSGYRPASRTLRLDTGANARLELTLAEDPAAPPGGRGRLRLALSDPTASELSVDDLPRPLASDGLALPSGPHVVRVTRLGFEPYQATIQIAAGRDTALGVTLAPTAETRAKAEETAGTRGTAGWSLVGGGLALVAGAGLYAILTRHDVSHAEAAIDQQVALEGMKDNVCYLGPMPINPGYYDLYKCAAIKSGLQDDVDSAKLKRVLAFSGMGVGVVVAGVGTYLLATRRRAATDAPSSPSIAFSIDRDAALAMLAGRF